MRVSILNGNWVYQDATGQCILHQVQFFQRRGDEVRVYVTHTPEGIPATQARLAQAVVPEVLASGADRHFATTDLYVYHYPGIYPLLETLKTIERGAVIFYYHNVTPPALWGSKFAEIDLKLGVEGVGGFAAYADTIVADSDFNAQQLESDYGLDSAAIRVLSLAVDLSRFSPGVKDSILLRRYGLSGKRVLLYVGRMAGNKRVDLLVESLAQVQAHIPNAVLLLVGDDRSNPAIVEQVAHARQRAAALNVAESVIFTGRVDDLPAHYHLADVYVTASLHEGFGVPLIEAMASGIPVIASDATAHPWVLKDAGLLFPPADVGAMTMRIVQVLSDDVLYGDLVGKGLFRAQDFSVETYEAGWSKIVSEATAWLPQRPYPLPKPKATLSLSQRAVGAIADESLTAEIPSLKTLTSLADIMHRDYRVHSGIPIIGPLISWIRVNLTSHLREPYVDPTFERQVLFNRTAVHTLERLFARIAVLESQLAKAQEDQDSQLVAGESENR
jgi:glycosyltransferase involved in cell wall biosynthesis